MDNSTDRVLSVKKMYHTYMYLHIKEETITRHFINFHINECEKSFETVAVVSVVSYCYLWLLPCYRVSIQFVNRLLGDYRL